MHAGPKKPSDDDRDLDEALRGTFPASDPVSPPSHVEEEMERRRAVLEEDAKKKQEERQRSQAAHSEELLDEALDETFPASDSVAVHGAAQETERPLAGKKAGRRVAKKQAVKAKSKRKTRR